MGDIGKVAPAEGRKVAVGQRGLRRRGTRDLLDVAGPFQCLDQGGPFGFGQVGVGKAREDGIARSHPRASQRQIFADPSRRASQQPCAADIRDQPDAAFGHRDAGGVAHDAVAGMTAKAHAAAHDEALHEGHNGLGVVLDGGVHLVFVAKEIPPDLVIARASRVIDGRDVAPCTEGPVTRRIHDDQIDRRIVAPVVQRRKDRKGHVMRQRIQRLLARQGDAPRAAFDANVQVFQSLTPVRPAAPEK